MLKYVQVVKVQTEDTLSLTADLHVDFACFLCLQHKKNRCDLVS